MADQETLLKHYNKDDEWFLKKGENIAEELKAAGQEIEKEAIEYGRDIINVLVKYMKSGPVLMMVVEGNKAVDVVVKLVGTTEPTTSDVGTIRGDYTLDSYGHATYENRAVRNLVHNSDCVKEAERELALWFSEDEIMDYTTAQERIMYDVNLDGTKE